MFLQTTERKEESGTWKGYSTSGAESFAGKQARDTSTRVCGVCWYDRRRKELRDDHYEELESIINTVQQAFFSDPAPDPAWSKFQIRFQVQAKTWCTEVLISSVVEPEPES